MRVYTYIYIYIRKYTHFFHLYTWVFWCLGQPSEKTSQIGKLLQVFAVNMKHLKYNLRLILIYIPSVHDIRKSCAKIIFGVQENNKYVSIAMNLLNLPWAIASNAGQFPPRSALQTPFPWFSNASASAWRPSPVLKLRVSSSNLCRQRLICIGCFFCWTYPSIQQPWTYCWWKKSGHTTTWDVENIIKPCKQWDKLPSSTQLVSRISSSKQYPTTYPKCSTGTAWSLLA